MQQEFLIDQQEGPSLFRMRLTVYRTIPVDLIANTLFISVFLTLILFLNKNTVYE